MRILKFTFALFFVSFITVSFAQEKPYLLIEDNDGQYDVFLKIENLKDVVAVDVVGSYSSNGEVMDLSVSIDKEGVASFNDNVALIHSLSKEVDGSSASYMVLLTNKKGEVTGYPLVTVSLNGPVQLASNL